MPLTCRGTLLPDFQPCGQGSYYEALCLRRLLFFRDSKSTSHRQTAPCLSLTLHL